MGATPELEGVQKSVCLSRWYKAVRSALEGGSVDAGLRLSREGEVGCLVVRVRRWVYGEGWGLLWVKVRVKGVVRRI